MPQDFISLDEASSELKVTRPTLYYYIKALKMETKKFPLDRKAYLPINDFETIKKWKEQAGERGKNNSGENAA